MSDKLHCIPTEVLHVAPKDIGFPQDRDNGDDDDDAGDNSAAASTTRIVRRSVIALDNMGMPVGFNENSMEVKTAFSTDMPAAAESNENPIEFKTALTTDNMDADTDSNRSSQNGSPAAMHFRKSSVLSPLPTKDKSLITKTKIIVKKEEFSKEQVSVDVCSESVQANSSLLELANQDNETSEAEEVETQLEFGDFESAFQTIKSNDRYSSVSEETALWGGSGIQFSPTTNAQLIEGKNDDYNDFGNFIDSGVSPELGTSSTEGKEHSFQSLHLILESVSKNVFHSGSLTPSLLALNGKLGKSIHRKANV
jgi:hypothetical protein